MSDKTPEKSTLVRAAVYVLAILIFMAGAVAGCAEIARHIEGPCRSDCTVGGNGGAGVGGGDGGD